MRAEDAFPSPFLKASQIKRPTDVQIDRVEMHQFDDGAKPVVYFVGKDPGVVLNRTRWNALVELCQNEDSNGWVGHWVTVSTQKVMFAGKSVDGIKFERSSKAQAEGPADDDIPF